MDVGEEEEVVGNYVEVEGGKEGDVLVRVDLLASFFFFSLLIQYFLLTIFLSVVCLSTHAFISF